MAKQQRMALLTGVCILAMFEAWLRGGSGALGVGLWICFIGSIWTCAARVKAIAGRLGGG
jgi:hypothetical protein